MASSYTPSSRRRRGRRLLVPVHAAAATSSPLHAIAARLYVHVHAIAARQNAVFDAGGDWGLFGLHAVPGDAAELVITEGEYDAMAVYQATGRAAVSLPNGAASLPPAVLPLLERFKRIFLWCDGDEVPARRPSITATRPYLLLTWGRGPRTPSTRNSHRPASTRRGSSPRSWGGTAALLSERRTT